jgi:cytochrome P450
MAAVRMLPGPRGHWLLGALPRLRSDMLGFFEECHRLHGDAAYFRVARRRTMLLSHPDDIEQVLVTENRRFIKNYALSFLQPLLGKGLLLNEGDSWLRQRKLIQPAFARPRVESYAPAMVEATERMLGGWRAGETIELAPELHKLTMTIAARSLLGIEISGQFGEVASCLQTVLHDFLARFRAAIPTPYWLPTPRNLRLKRAIRRLDAILQELVDERRASNSNAGGGLRGWGNDFLSILMQARDEDDGTGASDKQLRDEVMTLFVAGHETTANALGWTLYLLGLHPEIQRQVRDEVRTVLGERTPTAADLPRLALCERVIRESMRLFPPAYVIGRRPLEDITIGGHFIAAGTNVLMSQWIVHRDERWYDEPLRFWPDRWADGLANRLPKYAYFPFGGGPRVCIGNTFAMFEATLILALIAQRFTLELVSPDRTGATAQNPYPISLHPAVTLRPGEPICVRLVE